MEEKCRNCQPRKEPETPPKATASVTSNGPPVEVLLKAISRLMDQDGTSRFIVCCSALRTAKPITVKFEPGSDEWSFSIEDAT